MPSPQEREEALFRAAVELTPDAARRDFLDQVCAGDAALRARLEALLAAHHPPAAPPAPNAPAVKATLRLDLPDAEDEALGTRISHYKLLERVGEGGCGVVYVAEQTEPVRRRVALKVIKLGMDTKQVVARFEGERQALAMMDHPNIAKVLDGGSTETGRPYFVMELVRGIRITDYCDQHHLPTPARLDLFIQVCHAIQHAHQKGIIHRDIKPSNILVTLHDGVPVPKVIDFGIAKATTGQRLTDKTLFTAFEQFMGTPAYMSPEQAEMSGLDIDTRSDIYSLGVLLYELLAGSTPFDAKELIAQGLEAMVKAIREKEPPRPSTRLATLGGEELTTTAKRRAVEAPKLISLLKGDLDWIVMKCLEKDRTRRYETANAVAADLTRYLTHEPVLARPPSKLYRLGKSVRRNRLAYSAAAAVVGALALGVVFSTWQAARALRAEKVAAQHLVESEKARAAAEASEARAVAAERETKAKAEAERARERAEEIIKYMSHSLLGAPKHEPLTENQLSDWLNPLRQAVATNPTDWNKIIHLATVDLWLGQTNEHRTLCRKLLEWAANSEDLSALERAAKAYLLQSHPDEETLKEAVAAGRRALKLVAPTHINRGWFLAAAALAAIRDGAPAEAEPLLTEALNRYLSSRDCRGLALACRTMARVQLGRTNEARADFAELEKIRPAYPTPPTPSAILFQIDEMAVALLFEEAKALLNATRDAQP